MAQAAAQATSDTYRAKFEQSCPDCGSAELVEDHAQGDLICRRCGLVVEAHSIDERSEWRSFSDSDKAPGADPNRVGGPVNHLLSDGGLGTVIGAVTKGRDSGLSRELQRMSARDGGSAAADRHLVTAFRAIGALCDKLGLVRIIKDRACELYRDASQSKNFKTRGSSAAYAAVVYIACRQEGMARTFKEITAVCPDASKKDIGRAYKFIVAELEQTVRGVHPADFMRRFCSHLGLNNTDMKVAEQIAEAACPRADSRQPSAQKPWQGRSPVSIGAAIIFLLSNLPKASSRPPLADIAAVAGAAEHTIRLAYADLYPEAAELVPAWYAGAGDLARLPPPGTTGGGAGAGKAAAATAAATAAAAGPSAQ